MPVNFQFEDRETGEAKLLYDIDNEICEYLGVRPDPHRYNGMYDLIVMTGIGFLSNYGGSEIEDEDALKEYLDGREHLTQADKDVMVEFLFTWYRFKAWR